MTVGDESGPKRVSLSRALIPGKCYSVSLVVQSMRPERSSCDTVAQSAMPCLRKLGVLELHTHHNFSDYDLAPCQTGL